MSIINNFSKNLDSCPIYKEFENVTNHCVSDLNSENQEQSTYGFGWSQYADISDPKILQGFEAIYQAFKFKDADLLNGLPYSGKFNTYTAGGYVYEMRGKLSFVQGNLSILQELNWLDSQTRALFAEFSIYNPNLNLVCVCSVLFENLPFGNIISSVNFDMINLFYGIQTSSGGFDVMKILLFSIYMLVIVYLMIVEINLILKTKLLDYFTRFWKLLLWSLVACSWYSLAIFIYRVIEANKVLDFFKETSGYGYMNLSKLNYYNQSLSVSLALCCTLSTIQLLEKLRISKRIYSLVLTLIKCKRELCAFLFIFLYLWISFSNTAYLLFKDNLQSYSTYLNTIMSLFLLTLGKSNTTDLVSNYSFFGPLFYVIFNVMMVMIVINILISIVSDAYGELRLEIKDDYDLIDYVGDYIKTLYEKHILKKRKYVYKEFDHIEDLRKKVDNILKFSDEV